MKKRILSMLLALVMVISLIPVSTYAAAEDTVYISVSLDGAYLTAGTGTYKGKPMAYLPVTLKVLKNTVKLESFGLGSYVYDADGDGTEDITALHLLIYAHEKLYGTKWKNNVTVSGDPGSLTIQNEFDCGEQSDWMYKVNEWFPNYGCSSYFVEDGDVIVWCFTCKGLGSDVGCDWMGNE